MSFLRDLACGTLLLAAPLLAVNHATAQNAANADTTFNSFLSAYLVRSGGLTYFVNGLNDRTKAFFWGQCYMITAVEDAYDRVPTPANKQLVIDLINSQLNQDTYDWSWDHWNDDVEWGIIPLIRAYHITGNTTYLNVAVNNWNMVYNRGWDSTYGGGVWENMDNVPAGGKCGLSNWPLVIGGVLIYDANGDTTILSKCQAIFTWARTHCFDPNSGRVYEGYYATGLVGDDNVYNSGSLINAANALYKATGNSQYYNDAKVAADHVVNSTPILTHNGTDGSWADQFVRGLSRFARENNLWGNYSGWLNNQAASAWNHRRTDLNLTDNNWTNNTPGGETYAMNAVSAMVAQQVSQINPITGDHTIINQQNAEAVDNSGSLTASQKLILWGANRGPQQRWSFTQNSDTSWNIVSGYSAQAMDNGGSSANGAAVLQYPADSTNTNQRWWVDRQSDGSYKIWSKGTSQSLDSGGKSGNPVPLIQWGWGGTNNPQQRWNLQ